MPYMSVFALKCPSRKAIRASLMLIFPFSRGRLPAFAGAFARGVRVTSCNKGRGRGGGDSKESVFTFRSDYCEHL